MGQIIPVKPWSCIHCALPQSDLLGCRSIHGLVSPSVLPAQLSPLERVQSSLRIAGDFTPSKWFDSCAPRPAANLGWQMGSAVCVCVKGRDYSSNARGCLPPVKIRDEAGSAAGLSERIWGCILAIREVLLISLSSCGAWKQKPKSFR